TTSLPTTVEFPGPAALDRTAGELFVNGDYFPHGAIIATESAEKQPIPITTMLWNEPPDASGHVVVHVSATSAFAPFAPPIRNVWTQADAIDGAWTPASPAGAAGTQTFTFAAGAHEVHAFANDGQAYAPFAVYAHESAEQVVGPTTTLPIFVND